MSELTRLITEQKTSSVSAYLTQLNRVLSTQSGRIKGEVTSVKPSSKAVYFTIKDKDQPAILDCMIWLSTYQANGIRLEIGNEIIITGTPEIYAPFGKFSFKANTIEYAGEGALKQAYDRLKASLTAEGLLSQERKRALPDFPKKIGLITSMAGVVKQDFSANLSRHGFKITAIDSRVEGKDAIHELLAAIRTMGKQDIEVLVIMRGGGSLESLQAFNTESVVRAIASFKVPVITGIGHDVDVTLSQMVADIGRSTPTAVAEALNEPWDGLISSLSLLESKSLGRFQSSLHSKAREINDDSNKIFRTYERKLSNARSQVSDAASGLTSIFSRLSRRVRDANSALLSATGIMKSNIKAKRKYLQGLPAKLSQYSRSSLRVAEKNMANNFRSAVKRQADAIRSASQLIPVIERSITTNDPKRNMRLGYSLSYVNGKLARSVADVSIGEAITTQLADGEFTSEVKEVK